MATIDQHQIETIADALVERGYIVLEHAMAPALLADLLEHFNTLDQSTFKPAGIGREADFQLQKSVRSDDIYWLGANPELQATAEQQLLEWMNSLRTGLNRRLFLGLIDYESHFARYAAGAFYKKHVDAFATTSQFGKPKRVLSTVLYLNQDWNSQDGGELVLYADASAHVVEKIVPSYGKFVIFLSEKFPHEVLPAKQERKSIAGWFRANGA